MRMLSKEPEARGTAGAVAQELERLSRCARGGVDRPWLERSSPVSTGQAKLPSLTRRLEPKMLESLFVACTGLAALALVLLFGWFPEDPPKMLSGGEKPDAGMVRMGSAALCSGAPASNIPGVEQAVARDVPGRPFDGQKRPPCSSDEQPIKGGCWIPVGGKKPPCKEGWYEHEERCYAPFILLHAPPRTSEEPEKSRR